MDELAREVGERLKAARALLVTAESCTGGWVAQAVTSIAGSSDWFERGFVTYSNAAKEELLGVEPDTLKEHGAVSEETAREMAEARSRARKARSRSRSPALPARAAAAARSRWGWCASPGRARKEPWARRGISPATARACAGNR